MALHSILIIVIPPRVRLIHFISVYYSLYYVFTHYI